MAPHQLGGGRTGGMFLQNRDDLLGRKPGLPHLSSLVASKTTDGAQESSINWREWRGDPHCNFYRNTSGTLDKWATAPMITDN